MRITTLTWLLSTVFILHITGCGSAQSMWPAKQAQRTVVATKPKLKELPADRAAEVCLLTAQQLEEAGKDAEAIQQYQRARRYQPQLTVVPHRLAILYARTGDSVNAEKEFSLALSSSRKNADLQNDWGFYLASQQRWSEAEAAYQRAVELEPGHARARTNLALALGEQSKYEASFNLFQEVSGAAAAHRNVGVILARHQKPAEARDAFARAAAADPTDRRATQLLSALETSPEPVVSTVSYDETGTNRR